MYYFLNFRIMKTRVFFASMFAAATIGLLATSCSMNETEEINVPSSDAISINATTQLSTRATINDVAVMRADNAGFAVYGKVKNVTNDWYQGAGGTDGDIAGYNNHYYKAGKGEFKTPVKWPVDAAAYPMDFYAFYPSVKPAVFTRTDAFSQVKLNVSVPEDVDQQIDLLAGTGHTAQKPASANLTIPFVHTMSKFWFSITNTDGDHPATQFVSTSPFRVFILQLGFMNVNKDGVYDVVNNAWNDVVNPTGKYAYWNTFEILAGSSGHEEKEFFKEVEGKFFTKEFDSKYMMLIPQDQTSNKWITNDPNAQPPIPDAENIVPLPGAKTHVVMLYRAEDDRYIKPGGYAASDPVEYNYIGYKDARDHPDYLDSIPGTEHNGYRRGLYVKVGYSYDPIWLQGKGYHYNIPVPGATGGRLLDDNYYCEHGHRTPLKVRPTKPGQPIIDSDEYIHLTPKVEDWGPDINQSPEDI